MDENTLEFMIGTAFVVLLFLGLYALTRLLARLDRLLESRKHN